MTYSEATLRTALVDGGYVDEAVFTAAAKKALKKDKALASVLLDDDVLEESQLGFVLGEYFETPYVDLSKQKIDITVAQKIPLLVGRKQGILAFAESPKGVSVAMTDPTDITVQHLIEKRIGAPIIVHFTTVRALENALAKFEENIEEVFSDLMRQMQSKTISREAQDALMVQMVDTLLQQAHRNKASDIHIEPNEMSILVRYRIDGVLHDVLEMPKNIQESVLTRIKILSKMRTDEHRAAQDGKLRFVVANKKPKTMVDVRVSIVPITQGEKVVMRLLSEESRRFSMADLGMGEADLKKIRHAMDNPHGMILVTGPTGSGKTTSLYAMLKILNTREVNISTIEDPVEYDVEGVSQIQVNTKTDLTFAKGLRALVRQDPDIIMVGEIRDPETASIAVNSAMTGHLVLSTLHANDSATTLPRLLDMGVEPFLIASTVNVTIAQRLVRRICSSCRASSTVTDEQQELINVEPGVQAFLKKKNIASIKDMTVYQGKTCTVCGHTGYVGRLGIFEVLTMEENIRSLVVKRAPSSDIVAAARENGMTTMLEDGMEKVLAGMTTLEEVLRVTKG
jgi:type IV pilus assembly protein PilB